MTTQFKQNIQHLGNGDFLNDLVCPEIPMERKMLLWHGTSLPDALELLYISNHYAIAIDRLLKFDLTVSKRFSDTIKLVVFDVDGVMTDGGMYYTESGDELKKFNAKDGLAIRQLVAKGVITGIISHGINKNLIERRAALLGISRVYCGNQSKAEVLTGWCNEMGIATREAAFIGDDINDLPVIRLVGFSACPADAVPEVQKEVDLVLRKRGGEGCIREWLDMHI